MKHKVLSAHNSSWQPCKFLTSIIRSINLSLYHCISIVFPCHCSSLFREICRFYSDSFIIFIPIYLAILFRVFWNSAFPWIDLWDECRWFRLQCKRLPFKVYWTPLTGPMSNSNSVWSSNKQISRHNLSKHLCRNLYYFHKLHRDRIHAWILLGMGVYLFFLGVRMKRFLWIWKKLCRLFFFCWIWQRPFPCNILDQGEVICCFAVVVFPHPFGPMISTAPNVSNLSFKRLSTILALYSYSNFCFQYLWHFISNFCGILLPIFVVFYFQLLRCFILHFRGKNQRPAEILRSTVMEYSLTSKALLKHLISQWIRPWLRLRSHAWWR